MHDVLLCPSYPVTVVTSVMAAYVAKKAHCYGRVRRVTQNVALQRSI